MAPNSTFRVFAGRKIIKEGVLQKMSSSGVTLKRYCVLMSDILMYCKIIKVSTHPEMVPSAKLKFHLFKGSKQEHGGSEFTSMLMHLPAEKVSYIRGFPGNIQGNVPRRWHHSLCRRCSDEQKLDDGNKRDDRIAYSVS